MAVRRIMLKQLLMLMASRVTGDPYFANVKLLLHMDGADASTTFTDQIGHTFTARGNAQIDTSDSQFGGASALFDGTGDWIDTPDSADFTIGSGDMTAEFCLKANTSTITRYLCGQADASLTGTSISFYMYLTGTGFPGVTVYTGSTAKTVQGAGSIENDGLWHRLAAVISSGTLYLYLDGVSIGTPIAIGGAVNDSSEIFSIGAAGAYGTGRCIGWIDEFRLTIGTARYTGNYTPPTAAFPDS